VQLDEYTPKLKAWYDETTNDDSKQAVSPHALPLLRPALGASSLFRTGVPTLAFCLARASSRSQDITDKLQMEQWMRVCDEKDLVGIWECYRESDITGDPACKTQYKWRLSMPQVRMAFMDAQSSDQLGAAQSTGLDAMAVLDFDEWKETLARLGVDKFRAVKEVSPAEAVKGFIQNLLGEASSDEVVLQATHVHCRRYDASKETKLLNGETQADIEKWIATWEKMEIMDVHLWPMWEKEVHDILHPLFKELQLIFLAYTQSIYDVSAEDQMEMSLDEFHDFVVDVGLETKHYKFDVMCNQFIKANAINSAQVRAQRQEEKRDSQGKAHDKKEYEKKGVAKVTASDGGAVKKDQELNLQEFVRAQASTPCAPCPFGASPVPPRKVLAR
jgi:hypothetical protein